MKQTIDFYDFKRAFEQCRPDNFSREGLSVLWDYLEQYEGDTGEDLELDVIALCCDFSEGTYEEIAESYGLDTNEEIEGELEDMVREYLEQNGALVGEIAGGFVYRDF